MLVEIPVSKTLLSALGFEFDAGFIKFPSVVKASLRIDTMR